MICLSIGDINFDNLVKVMFAKFFHYKVVMNLCVISKYFMRRYFETMYISSFIFKQILPSHLNY